MQLFHQLGRSVADVQGNRFRQLAAGVRFCGLIRPVEGIGARGQGQIDHGLGQVEIALGHAVEMAGLVRRHRDLQSLIVRQPDVLAGKADEPAGDEQGILPGLQHPGQPVDGGVRVGIAHGLVEGGYQVVMLLAVLVIQ